MFWLRWLVTAESNSDPHAAINSHRVLSPGLGAASAIRDVAAAVPAWVCVGAATLTSGDGYFSTSRTSVTFLLVVMITPQTTTNERNPMDHASVCVRRLKFGSTSSG